MKKKASNQRLESPDPGKEGIYIKTIYGEFVN